MSEALEQDQKRLIEPLRHLSRAQLLAMYEAAAEATDAAAQLADRGTNPVTAVLGDAQAVEEWAHFPPGDIRDPRTHCQFYYHSHAASERVAGEHGHFHTFVRPRKLALAFEPARFGERARPQDEADWVMHLVGISTDAGGRLIRLFTTNRWVTGEVWYEADAVIAMLERFEVTTREPSPQLSRWITGVVGMFRLQIAELIRRRDARIAEFGAAHPGSDILENRDLQVTSEMPVDFLTQIRAIETALAVGPAS
jgi:hypothetical protein